MRDFGSIGLMLVIGLVYAAAIGIVIPSREMASTQELEKPPTRLDFPEPEPAWQGVLVISYGGWCARATLLSPIGDAELSAPPVEIVESLRSGDTPAGFTLQDSMYFTLRSVDGSMEEVQTLWVLESPGHNSGPAEGFVMEATFRAIIWSPGSYLVQPSIGALIDGERTESVEISAEFMLIKGACY